MRLHAPLFSGLAVLALCRAAAQEPVPRWQSLEEVDGIKSYIAPVEGSKYSQFMAEGVLPVRMETLVELLRDVPTYRDWICDCKELTLLEDRGNDSVLAYYVHNTPWPIDDRNTVVQSAVANQLEQGRFQLRIDSVHDPRFGLSKDRVEMFLHAVVDCQYVDREHVKVTYSLKFDPGGDLSPTLVERFSRSMPLDSLLKLKHISKKQTHLDRGKHCKELPLIVQYAKKGGK